MFGKKKVVNHEWEFLPYFQVIDGPEGVASMVIAVQVCKKTGACQYVRVPSQKKLKQMEEEYGK